MTENYIKEIKDILTAARQKAYAAINSTMVEAYWQIGRRIVEEEQQGEKRAEYGEQIVRELSKALTAEFGKGFSYANLKNFRQFYLRFPDIGKGYAVRSLLSWTHYRLIMRVDDEDARRYYIQEAVDNQWSSRTLERNINSFYYQRLLSTRNSGKKAELQTTEQEKQHPRDFIKDPYVFEFLNLPEPLQATEKDETMVKYSILAGNEQLFASKYMPWLPTEEELIAEVERERLALQKKSEDSSDDL